MNVACVIAAAGLSSRMGAFKPLLPINGRPMLCFEIDRLLSVGVKPILVVTGHRSEEIDQALQHYSNEQVRTVFNPDYRGDMLLSVKLGAQHIPSDIDAFFFLPADCPTVRPETLHALIHYQGTEPVRFPKCNNRRGHPPLISTDLCHSLLDFNGTGGLKQFLASFPQADVIVDDWEIRRDLDTPADYQDVLKSL